MTARRLALSLFLAASIAAPARAAVPAPHAWSRLQDAAPDPTMGEAAMAFEAGEAAFEAGEFEAAIEQFSRAQALLPHPHTAYNLGLAQAKAGHVLDAFSTFAALRDEAVDPERRAEAQLQLARLAPSVAQLEVRASEGQVVRVGGVPVDTNVVHLRSPGPVAVEVGTQTVQVDLGGGELRVLDVRTIEQEAPAAPSKRGRLGVLVATAVAGAGTAGTVTSAAVLGPRGPGPTLGYAAAGLGGATLALATTALILRLRDRKRER
ncbi:MAG: tetratricopeptide repeat protein [Nannocystaceae bacterium]|nr:tetratricopeptide repeat protein [bacterium]